MFVCRLGADCVALNRFPRGVASVLFELITKRYKQDLGIQVFRVPQDILDGVVYQDSTEDLENMVEKVEVCELPEHLTGNWLEIRSIATTYQPFVFPSIRYVRNVEYQTTSMTCCKAQQSMSGAIYVTKPSNALSI